MSLNALIANAGARVESQGNSILQGLAFAQQRERQNQLSDLASKAAGGDKAALSQVAGLDPQTYRQISSGLASMSEQQRAAYKDSMDQFTRVAMWADTPEKWDQAVGVLSKQYPEVAQYKGQFQAREPMIAMGRSVKEMLDSGTVFSGGGVAPIPGAIESGAAKIGAETAAKEANSYQSFAPGSVVIPPQGGQTAGLGRGAAPPPAQSAPRQAPAVPEVFRGIVTEHAERTGLSPQLVGSLLMAESGGNPNAVSDKGARGLMQVMPGTASDPGFGVAPARDASPEENVRVGTDYLAALKNKYGGDERLALAAYNWGPGNVDDWLAAGADPRKVPGETQRYVYKITGGLVTAPQGQRVQVADSSGGLPAGAFVVPDPKLANGPKRGLTPVYGKDANGNDVIIQLGEDGTATQTPLPNGVTLSNGAQRVDLGTEIGLLDRNGALIGKIPKDIAGEEVQKARGKAQGQREADSPGAARQADFMLSAIDGVLNHPGREFGTGKSARLNLFPGTDGYDFQKRLDQLGGMAFLQAFDSLKGGGQITEVEGKKATEAIARLDPMQSEEGFVKALQELRSVVEAARSRALQQAGPQSPMPAQPATPAVPSMSAGGAPPLPPGFAILE